MQPNGTLGKPVIGLLQAHGFNLTLLTRNLEKTKQALPDIRALEADHDAVEALERTLKENVGQQDAVVDLVNRNEAQAQINLIDAAIAAKIPHFVPSCFGLSMREPAVRALPIWETKTRMKDNVLEKSGQGAITFTGIQTGPFLDWAIERES